MSAETPRYQRELDLRQPCSARITDAFLGGCHNFGAERGFVLRAERALPGITELFLQSRDFLRRAVDHALSCGIHQFLDLGSGLPTVGHIHEIAGRITPHHRVVYVDNEPLTAAHGARILGEEPRATVLHEDCRDPEAVLDAAERHGRIDWNLRVALVATGVLHFLPEEAEPFALLEEYRRGLPEGSHLVLGHVTGSVAPEAAETLRALYAETTDPLFPRDVERIDALFGDFERFPPGPGQLSSWRPDPHLRSRGTRYPLLHGGIARKPVRSTGFRAEVRSTAPGRPGPAPGEPQQDGGEHGHRGGGQPRLGEPRVGSQQAE
ncbi:hypothetical protein CEP50_00795 [Actinopolyspora mortivallis]|uniref:S-adenosyl methyltransferase n=1 Tax=Actinopolyspora mortivallis TaxID=33906 RepID=A0A2T0H1H2_ACTMO|nr:hypothetical protein CEP50_00795 [Actinopolyspora mortivallis]